MSLVGELNHYSLSLGVTKISARKSSSIHVKVKKTGKKLLKKIENKIVLLWVGPTESDEAWQDTTPPTEQN